MLIGFISDKIIYDGNHLSTSTVASSWEPSLWLPEFVLLSTREPVQVFRRQPHLVKENSLQLCISKMWSNKPLTPVIKQSAARRFAEVVAHQLQTGLNCQYRGAVQAKSQWTVMYFNPSTKLHIASLCFGEIYTKYTSHLTSVQQPPPHPPGVQHGVFYVLFRANSLQDCTTVSVHTAEQEERWWSSVPAPPVQSTLDISFVSNLDDVLLHQSCFGLTPLCSLHVNQCTYHKCFLWQRR